MRGAVANSIPASTPIARGQCACASCHVYVDPASVVKGRTSVRKWKRSMRFASTASKTIRAWPIEAWRRSTVWSSNRRNRSTECRPGGCVAVQPDAPAALTNAIRNTLSWIWEEADERPDRPRRAAPKPFGEDINVSDPKIYQQDVWMHYFLAACVATRSCPFASDSPIGPFWSVTRSTRGHHLDRGNPRFSVVVLRRHHAARPHRLELPMFIAMDQPAHDEQRKIVQPSSRPGQPESSRTDPLPHRQDLDLPRGEAGLGRSRVDRTDRPDAGDAVRLPVRGSQAHLLVGRRHDRSATRRPSFSERSERLCSANALGYFTGSSGTSA